LLLLTLHTEGSLSSYKVLRCARNLLAPPQQQLQAAPHSGPVLLAAQLWQAAAYLGDDLRV
jgi:hypothetical protein